jgi:hypothetical protein
MNENGRKMDLNGNGSCKKGPSRGAYPNSKIV